MLSDLERRQSYSGCY